MSAAPSLSESARAWERVRDFAVAKGWTVDLTPGGRTRCAKAGSFVFGPGSGASICAYHELIERLEHVDGFMAAHTRSRP
jgi:hypothetical protein